MKNKILKKLSIIALIFIALCTINSYAANGNFTVSAQTQKLEKGKTTTLTIGVSNCVGKFSISSSDESVVSVSSASEWVDGNTSVTLTAKKAGTATITVTAQDVSSIDEKAVTGSKNVTITVTEPPKQEDPKPSQGNTTPQNNVPQNNVPQNNVPQNNVPQNNVPQNNVPQNNVPQNNVTTPPVQEPTFSNVNDIVYAQSNVNIRDTYSTSGKIVGSLQKGESITRTGIGSNGWDRVLYQGSVAYINKGYITTVKPEQEETKSSNKALKELKVTNYDLEPAFDPQTTKYSLTLKSDEKDNKLDITALPDDEEKATVEITGNENFKIGNNIVKIIVTAEDSTTRIYTITVSKANSEGLVEGLKLSALQIPNATLEPKFDPDITSYVIHVEDPSAIKASNVVATAANSDVIVSTAENEISEDGEKVITIMLESKDGTKTGVYQISVKKPVTTVESLVTEKNDNSLYYILGGVIGVLLLLIIIIIIVLKKTSDNDDDYYDDDNEYDDEEDDNEDYSSNYTSKKSKNYNNSLKNVIDETNTTHKDDEEEFRPKSQILNKKISMFDDDEELDDLKGRTKSYNFSNDDLDYSEDEDIGTIDKKKGKHF